MRVALAQFYTQNVPYGNFSEEINKKYCEEKGYSYIVEKNNEKLREWSEDRAFTWIKPKFITSILETKEFDYVLFLDIDAIISNFDQKIEEFIDEKYDMVASEDYSSHSLMNAGVLLIKNSDWSLDFMKDWWNCGYYLKGSDVPELGGFGEMGCYKNALWHDQTCLTYLCKRADRKNHIKIISNRSFNWKDYDDNNFIFHAFAYGNIRNRKIDTAYYKLFNIKINADEKNLIDLAEFYSTDKETEHKYISNYYQNELEAQRESLKRFCEIGPDINSMKMWKDYFKNAEVIGCSNKELNEERLKIINLDQSSDEELNKFCESQEEFDVILDDGTHKMKDQQVTLAKLFKKLKPKGLYIIEDLHTSIEAKMPEKYVFGWGDPNKTTTLEMLEKFIETGEVLSDYLCEEDRSYLKENIEKCEVLRKDNNYFSITSFIKKK
jgi:hypothetical protein